MPELNSSRLHAASSIKMAVEHARTCARCAPVHACPLPDIDYRVGKYRVRVFPLVHFHGQIQELHVRRSEARGRTAAYPH